jgi:hypothetical protein
MLERMYKNHNQFWELVTDDGKVRPSAVERRPEASKILYTKAQTSE